MTSAARAFYTTQSPASDPGEFAGLLAPLPADAAPIVEVVSGLVLHPVFLDRRRVRHPHAKDGDAEVRPARELIRRLVERDARPLGVARPYERRVIGTCRHYALLATAILRHQARRRACESGSRRTSSRASTRTTGSASTGTGRRGGCSTPSWTGRPSRRNTPSTSGRGTCRVTASSPPARPGAPSAAAASTPTRAACRSFPRSGALTVLSFPAGRPVEVAV